MRFYWLEHGKERKVTAKSGPTIRASQAAEKRRMAGERAEKHPYKGLKPTFILLRLRHG
jgi:hypothetical protein